MVVVAILFAACCMGWWAELTTKVKVGDIRELYLGENHPLNGQPVRIAHKGIFLWKVYTQRCLMDTSRESNRTVKVKGTDTLKTGSYYEVSALYTEDLKWHWVPISRLRGISEPQTDHACTDGMRYASDAHMDDRLNAWYPDF